MPATLAVLALFLDAYARERAGIERASLDVSRALMQAIDRELASAGAALQALATSPSLDRDGDEHPRDLHAFRIQAVDVLRARPGNILVLTGPDLRQALNTGLPIEAGLPLHGNPAGVRRVFASARPMVSDLYYAPGPRRLLSSVDVPVVREGQVRWVLSMQYFGERLGAILESQQLPPGASVSIYDGAARIVWSSRALRTEVGQHASSALAGGLALGPEGMVDEADTGDGRVTVFSRSAISNWTVAIALQRSELNASLWQSLRWIVLGVLLLLALGAFLVRLVGARIEEAVRGLVRPALALGTGEQAVLPPLRLQEAHEVGHALVKAAALLRERTIERDEAERAQGALRQAKRALKRSEAFLRGIFEETPDGVLLVDGLCHIARANAQAERMFGSHAGGLAGQSLDDLLTDPAHPGPVGARILAAQGRSAMGGTTALRGRRRDGTLFPADTMTSRFAERDLAIVTVRDVTAGWEQEEALRRALEDKNTLLKELSHRVKNNLQLIISLFNLQARALAPTEMRARQALLEAASRVRAMALVHERLCQTGTVTSIAVGDYVAGLCEQLARAASAGPRGIVLSLDVAPVECSLDVAVPLGLLLNELVSNSLKHAFPDGRGGTIAVRLVREGRPGSAGEDMAPGAVDVRLTVSDDGIGLQEPVDRTSGHKFGLKLVDALSDQLHAKLTHGCPDGTGTCVTLVFCIPAARGAPM